MFLCIRAWGMKRRARGCHWPCAYVLAFDITPLPLLGSLLHRCAVAHQRIAIARLAHGLEYQIEMSRGNTATSNLVSLVLYVQIFGAIWLKKTSATLLGMS